ncbi:MAG: filamentous hemagglutinin N-terminal domain-containing protein [Snowella sp.]|nr:filamentous hemagglutinin N-terminal domain-containing protein [Snowella sp.]
MAITLGNSFGKVYAQVSSDNTLSTPTQVLSTDSRTFIITDGTQAGSNLFHSFRDFSVPTGGSATFLVPDAVANIISRVTGANVSSIDGLVSLSGKANLFLLNPNGISFGPNASIDISGSFFVSTAEAIRFADGQIFSATNTGINSLLTVSVPMGLQFGSQANPIQSQNSTLAVEPGQTIAFIGGDLSLNRSILSAPGGRIELGSVGPQSQISLQKNDTSYALGYEKVKVFQDIQLSQGTSVDVSDLSPLFAMPEIGSGAIQMVGKQISVTDGSSISSFTLGEKSGQSIFIQATEQLDVSGVGNNFNNFPSDISSSIITTTTVGNGNGGDIRISAKSLSLRDGAGISTLSADSGFNPQGNAGNIIINASDSVTIAGSSSQTGTSGITVSTRTAGNAGNLTITTGTLSITDGGKISAETLGIGQGGNINILARQGISMSGQGMDAKINTQGNPTLFLSPSLITAISQSTGNAGSLFLNTPQLRMDQGAEITVSSTGSGQAGNLNIQGQNVLLNNQSKLFAETSAGTGGNIQLDLSGILLLRHNSSISATAGTTGGGGDGGNIDINAQFVVAFPTENSDIVANAYTGQGGNILINTQGIFGIEPRTTLTPLSDITASSTFGEVGVISLNRLDIDPQSGLLKLPDEILDPQDLVVQACSPGGEFTQSEFILQGRGGLPPNPIENEPIFSGLTDLGYPSSNQVSSSVDPGQTRLVSPRSPSGLTPSLEPSTVPTAPIIEARGWQKDSQGKITLIAQSHSGQVFSTGITRPNCHEVSSSSFPLLAP